MHKEVILSFFSHITVVRYRQLVAQANTFKEIRTLPVSTLRSFKWPDDILNAFLAWRNSVSAEAIEQLLKDHNIQAIPISDPSYPRLLKEIYDPPFCLFVRGSWQEQDTCLAIVGTRKYSSYGRHVAEQFAQSLSAAGLTIVSGLARGIDSFAHRATIAQSGRTIAVLGSGIDDASIAPRGHVPLAKEIIANGGALISEYAPGTEASKFTFPRRNRIIAGLSLGTLVVEAKEKSGALITADCTLQHNRELFAIPHNITNEAGMGPNHLIEQGAHPALSPQHILDVLDIESEQRFRENRALLQTTPQEATILERMSGSPCHIDVLIQELSLSAIDITSTVTLLEMKGLIKNIGNMTYVRQ